MTATTGQQNISPVAYGGSFPYNGGGPQVGACPANGGTFVANGATPVTVANANLTANSIILISLKTPRRLSPLSSRLSLRASPVAASSSPSP